MNIPELVRSIARNGVAAHTALSNTTSSVRSALAGLSSDVLPLALTNGWDLSVMSETHTSLRHGDSHFDRIGLVSTPGEHPLSVKLRNSKTAQEKLFSEGKDIEELARLNNSFLSAFTSMLKTLDEAMDKLAKSLDSSPAPKTPAEPLRPCFREMMEQ
jgi:hypothetical protein